MPSHHPQFFFSDLFDRIAVQWSIVIQRPYLGKLQMWQGREKDLLNIQTEGLARRARLELRRTAWMLHLKCYL